MPSQEYETRPYLQEWVQNAALASNKTWLELHTLALTAVVDFCETQKLEQAKARASEMKRQAGQERWGLRWWRARAEKLDTSTAERWADTLGSLLYGQHASAFRSQTEGRLVQHLEMVLWEIVKTRWEPEDAEDPKEHWDWDNIADSRYLFSYARNLTAEDVEANSMYPPETSQKATLQDWEIVWDIHRPDMDGCLADITPKIGSGVEGMLHKLGRHAVSCLTASEYAVGREPRKVSVEADGTSVEAMVFVWAGIKHPPPSWDSRPAVSLASKMLAEAETLGFSDGHIAYLRERVAEAESERRELGWKPTAWFPECSYSLRTG